jgi:23S rRNA (cytosine1962-C5)-methyltransferase
MGITTALVEQTLVSLLNDAFERRQPLIDPLHCSALRLFNGFSEGCPDLVIDLYGETAVLQNFADPAARAEPLVHAAQGTLQTSFPWLKAGLIKTRNSQSYRERCGILAFGQQATRKICEHGLWYAIDLTLHQDCSFYLDTRNLRKWALEHLRGRAVLNAFAYTGSLGVAALAGGAERVVQLDRTQHFLDVARASYALNDLPVHANDFVRADFFHEAGRLRRLKHSFDCVFLDPPFFASSSAGLVDQESGSARLINKVRPLVARGGYLVTINNALYVSGRAYMQVLESLCMDGHLEITELIPVPQDFIGLSPLRHSAPITDPAPFNHSTKIAVLRIRRESNHAAREESDAPGSGS